MRLIDADAAYKAACEGADNWDGAYSPYRYDRIREEMDKVPTFYPWRRVEDDPPDEKDDAIFYYEWTGIDGTVHKDISIVSLDTLIAVGCRPIAWMEKPKPPKEDA